MSGFEDLVVWQRAVDLSAEIYLATKELTDFGFRDQITRSGLSIPSNIAEGMERSTTADQCKFLDYARGSCGEARTQTIVGAKVGFITPSIAEKWILETKEISAMIQGLIKSIRSRRLED
jgi:four helix bundle protein